MLRVHARRIIVVIIIMYPRKQDRGIVKIILAPALPSPPVVSKSFVYVSFYTREITRKTYRCLVVVVVATRCNGLLFFFLSLVYYYYYHRRYYFFTPTSTRFAGALVYNIVCVARVIMEFMTARLFDGDGGAYTSYVVANVADTLARDNIAAAVTDDFNIVICNLIIVAAPSIKYFTSRP